jgi:PAS domain S-box-containing protein
MTLTARLTTAMVALVLVTAGALSVLSTFIAGVVAVLGAILLAAMLARSLALPIEQMSAAVEAFGRDEWMAVPVDAGGEVGVLARSFERMAKEVREKTRALRQEVDTRECAVAALRDSLSRQEAIFASPLVGILTLNESGSIESLNPEAERIFGRAGETLVRRDICRLIDLPSGDGFGNGARLRQLVTQDGEPRELVGRSGDGTTFPIDCVLGEMAVGGRRMFVMFVRNISKRKRNERLKDDFVATVSHELRTPLTSIAGSLGLLIGGASGKLPASAARLLSIAYTNSQRLVRLINDILDIEKIESGKVTFYLQPVELRPLIEQAIEANRGFADGYGARIVLDPAAPTATVRADVDRMMQVVTNLLSNAVKFSPTGEVVEISIEPRGETVRVSVRDHGPGIPDEFKMRIFDKFAQADASDARQKGGTGLGLNIVKQIITQHGGKIGFEAAPGGGTIFYFELPRIAALARHVEASAAAAQPRLMICDDDPDVSSPLAAKLRGMGFAVDIASSAAEALACAADASYTAFLVDLALPDLDGISLLQQLRTEPRHAETATIVISANPERGRADLRSSSLNVLDWLNKPVDLEHLAGLVNRAVTASRNGRACILHVDDDRDVLHLVAETLRGDADVVSANSIGAARTALSTGHFDLAVLDLSLADGFGLDLLSELHDRDGKSIPVVVFSAQDANPEVAVRVEAMLTKSRTSIDKLVGILRRIVADRGRPTLPVVVSSPAFQGSNREVA